MQIISWKLQKMQHISLQTLWLQRLASNLGDSAFAFPTVPPPSPPPLSVIYSQNFIRVPQDGAGTLRGGGDSLFPTILRCEIIKFHKIIRLLHDLVLFLVSFEILLHKNKRATVKQIVELRNFPTMSLAENYINNLL